MKTNLFEDSLKKGKATEDTVMNLMDNHAKWYVVPVRDVIEWRRKDIDFLFINKYNNYYSRVECKSWIGWDDAIIIELYDRIETNHKGWFYTTEADDIIWAKGQTIIWVKWQPFKEWVEKVLNDELFQGFKAYFTELKNKSDWKGGNTATSLCYIVNINGIVEEAEAKGIKLLWTYKKIKKIKF